MEKTLKFKKVAVKDKRQTFYELSEPITKAPNKNWNLNEELNYSKHRLKKEYRKYVPNDSINIICISDAHTHTERLVFPGCLIKHTKETPTLSEKDVYHCLIGLSMDGVNTMLIHGGDISTIHEPEYYLKRIAESNNMNYEIIE